MLNLKAMYFKNKHGNLLFLCLILISIHNMILYARKLEKLNHNFNYTHTSLNTKSLGVGFDCHVTVP